MHNATITYVDLASGDRTEETFCDPYIYTYGGQLWHWNGKEWHRGVMTYGGKPIVERLRNLPFNPETDAYQPPSW